MRKIAIIFVMICLLSVVMTGCGSKTDMLKVDVWDITVNRWYTTNRVQDRYYGYYYADPGYIWLVFEITVSNKTKESQTLDFFLADDIKYISDNEIVYDMKLILNSPVDQLPEYYNPLQTQTGLIFFEVLDSTNVDSGKLIFDIQGEAEGEWVYTLPGD